MMCFLKLDHSEWSASTPNRSRGCIARSRRHRSGVDGAQAQDKGAVPRDVGATLTLPRSGSVSSAAYFASGSGRSWNFTTLLVVPLPPSMWNGARVLTVDQIPRPFHPAAGSSTRPSIHFV